MAGVSSVADGLQRCGTESASATPNSLKEKECFDVADKMAESSRPDDVLQRLIEMPDIGV